MNYRIIEKHGKFHAQVYCEKMYNGVNWCFKSQYISGWFYCKITGHPAHIPIGSHLRPAPVQSGWKDTKEEVELQIDTWLLPTRIHEYNPKNNELRK